jgi:Carboxypeptidase regulatory-like domain
VKRSRAGLLATAVAAGMFFLAAGIALFAPAAQAQNIGNRTVTGTVLNADSAPVTGATVFLRNEKTKTIRSYSTAADGHFHFAQVDMTADFDLWAEKDTHKSAVKTVSSWDARKEFVSDLKLK